VLSAVLGYLRTVQRDEPVLGPIGSRVFVVTAWFFLFVDYGWLSKVHVIALSHFMILVCVSKFLQKRTARDDATFFILSLLLLLVAAVVSGNVVFLPVLVVHMTVGLDALIRWYQAVEQARTLQHNHTIDPSVSTADGYALLPYGWRRIIMASR